MSTASADLGTGGDRRTGRRSVEARAGGPRLAAGAIAFAAAVALVGAGTSSSGHVDGSQAADTVLTTMAVVVGGATSSFVAWVLVRTHRPAAAVGDPDEPIGYAPPWLLRPLLASTLATLALLLAFTFVIGPLWLHRHPEPGPAGNLLPTTTAPGAVPGGGTGQLHPSGQPAWSVVAAVSLLVLASALLVVTVRTRRPVGPRPPPDLDQEITAALEDLDALAADPDHRRVVIRAYARMERALARTGASRAASETPREFLGRALTMLGASAGPARRLTDLFEQARFSTHPVDAGMRAEASLALRAVQAELNQ